MPGITRTQRAKGLRILGSVVLVLATLFYLQFGAQAIPHSVPQAALTFLGALGLGWASFRVARGELAAGTVFLATLPLLIFSIVYTLLDPNESPIYIAGSGVAPLLAGMIWLVRRLRSRRKQPTRLSR